MITVDLLDYMGTDLTVVNAARVSFDKESEWECDESTCPLDCDMRDAYCGDDYCKIIKSRLSDKDTKLIKYLATHEHWSPFAHPQASFRVAAPIFVARQLQKHTVGLAWNEVSRRYVDSEPTFYTPDRWRKRAADLKQGSSDKAVDIKEYGYAMFSDDPDIDPYEVHIEESTRFYEELLAKGVCPEQARMVLPQSMMTEWHWTGSLYAFARVCKLRLDAHTQRETQEVAKQIAKHMAGIYPVSWAALVPGCQD